MRDLLDDGDVPADSLSRVFVETRHSKAGFFMMDELMEAPRTANHAWGRVLVGEPRCGKTTFVKEYLKACRDGVGGRKPLRFLYVELTQDTKPTSIAYETLNRMDNPNPAYGSPAVRTTRVIAGIERRGYDLIIYDEAHYLVDSATARVREDGVSWFNGLLNQSRCPLLLVGYEKLMPVVRKNASLGGRVLPFPALRPHNHADADDLLEFRLVLRALEPQLGFPTPSRLSDKAIAARICVTCRGRLGLVEAYLSHARTLAQRERHSCLTKGILAEAADGFGQTWEQLPFNPFKVEDLGKALKEAKIPVYPRGLNSMGGTVP